MRDDNLAHSTPPPANRRATPRFGCLKSRKRAGWWLDTQRPDAGV